MKPFLVNLETTILYDKVRKSGLDKQKDWKIFKLRLCLHLDRTITFTYKRPGRKTERLCLRLFWWYNIKRCCSNPETDAKKTKFLSQQRIDMLKIWYTFSNLAIKCLNISKNYKFSPVCKSDQDLYEKTREDVKSAVRTQAFLVHVVPGLVAVSQVCRSIIKTAIIVRVITWSHWTIQQQVFLGFQPQLFWRWCIIWKSCAMSC